MIQFAIFKGRDGVEGLEKLQPGNYVVTITDVFVSEDDIEVHGTILPNICSIVYVVASRGFLEKCVAVVSGFFNQPGVFWLDKKEAQQAADKLNMTEETEVYKVFEVYLSFNSVSESSQKLFFPICPECKEPIKTDHAKVWDDIEQAYMHLDCSIEVNEDLSIWGYEGDG